MSNKMARILHLFKQRMEPIWWVKILPNPMYQNPITWPHFGPHAPTIEILKDTEMGSEIQNMSDKHRAIMRDMVLLGMTSREVASKYDLSEQHVSIMINSPIWKKEAAILHDDTVGEYRGRIMTKIPRAIEAAEEIMNRTREVTVPASSGIDGETEIAHVPNPPASRLKAAEMFLKMGGLIGEKEHSGAKSVVLNLVQPGWDTEDGVPSITNIQINQ